MLRIRFKLHGLITDGRRGMQAEQTHHFRQYIVCNLHCMDELIFMSWQPIMDPREVEWWKADILSCRVWLQYNVHTCI